MPALLRCSIIVANGAHHRPLLAVFPLVAEHESISYLHRRINSRLRERLAVVLSGQQAHVVGCVARVVAGGHGSGCSCCAENAARRGAGEGGEERKGLLCIRPSDCTAPDAVGAERIAWGRCTILRVHT